MESNSLPDSLIHWFSNTMENNSICLMLLSFHRWYCVLSLVFVFLEIFLFNTFFFLFNGLSTKCISSYYSIDIKMSWGKKELIFARHLLSLDTHSVMSSIDKRDWVSNNAIHVPGISVAMISCWKHLWL